MSLLPSAWTPASSAYHSTAGMRALPSSVLCGTHVTLQREVFVHAGLRVQLDGLSQSERAHKAAPGSRDGTPPVLLENPGATLPVTCARAVTVVAELNTA